MCIRDRYYIVVSHHMKPVIKHILSPIAQKAYSSATRCFTVIIVLIIFITQKSQTSINVSKIGQTHALLFHFTTLLMSTTSLYSSASPLCIDVIAWCPTHPSFNHRRSSFSSRCCPTVEHSTAERHVGVVIICFQETFEDPSLQSFFLWIYCSACVVTLSFRTL